MKKLLLVFLITNIMFVGCTEEECYSCDSKIDAWVKENASELKKMNRTELSKLEISYQKAAMRMFSPDRKKTIWLDKFNLIKKLPFNKLEKEHLKFAEQFLKNHDFKKAVSEEIEKELLDWAIEGKDKFKWSDEFLVKAFFLIGDFNYNKNGLDELSDPASNAGGNCNCRYHLGCGGPNYYCTSEECDETDEGCGLFGTSSCTGKCD